MRIPRIYVTGPLAPDSLAQLEGNAANHVVKVLRLSAGAPLTLFNGGGGEFEATLDTVGKAKVIARVGRFVQHEVESPLEIHIAQGISRGDRMDYAVQKAVELGVTRVIPIVTARCGVKLSHQRLEKRGKHWQAIAAHACEQCGRNRIPQITSTVSLEHWLNTEYGGQSDQGFVRLLLEPTAAETLSGLKYRDQTIALIIGPEGGLSSGEIQLAQDHGFMPVRLGPRILRTETSTVAALSVLQALWGDLR